MKCLTISLVLTNSICYQFINLLRISLFFLLDIAINKKVKKQKSSSSLSDDDSEETGKVKYKKERMQHNKTDTAEDIYRRNNQQLSQHSEQKNIENTEQSDWHIESATTFKSVLLNKTVEESLIYRKKYILSEDVNTAVCDRSPSPSNNAKSHRKSRKRLMSELNAWDLKQKKVVSFQYVLFLHAHDTPAL